MEKLAQIEQIIESQQLGHLDVVKTLTSKIDDIEHRIWLLFEMIEDIQSEFDGSDYMQGKKDGIRLAYALITNDPVWIKFNRGESFARE